MTDEKSLEIMKAAVQIQPYFDRTELVLNKKNLVKLPLGQIATVAGTAVSFAEPFRTAASALNVGAVGGPGIYSVTFANGVSGALASFHDGSGFLGSIVSSSGIVGQARLNPISELPMTTTIPIDPITIGIAVAVAGIEKKLDTVIAQQEQIIDFLERKEKAKTEALLHELNTIHDSFRRNWSSQQFVQASLVRVMSVKKDAKQGVVFYSTRAKDRSAKKDLLHLDHDSDGLFKEVQDDFGQYRLSLYLYAYAAFLETLLLRHFDEANIEAVCQDVRSHVSEYLVDYSACYQLLADYSRASVQTKVKGGAAKALKGLGGALRKIPVIEKAPLDEALLFAGEAVGDAEKSNMRKILNLFLENRDSGALPFAEALERVGELYNEPLELLVDGDEVYLVES